MTLGYSEGRSDIRAVVTLVFSYGRGAVVILGPR